ncbi:SH3 domain-binding protein 5-like [Leptonychotes weddellii]|uniref:SH3 domain-binding protein 5 n=1 Tax=Leptonychotes weddellii TaxID=9713 RepID=A0A7F8RML4_LEPWE|nr:SH3 domain-binding protein 5-like [Leptonychotes weddellii]
MDAALKRSRSEEPAELPPSARDLEEEEEEGMEQGLEEEEEVDPRIQGELEKLNQSTDDINRRETELEVLEAGSLFGEVVSVLLTPGCLILF